MIAILNVVAKGSPQIDSSCYIGKTRFKKTAKVNGLKGVDGVGVVGKLVFSEKEMEESLCLNLFLKMLKERAVPTKRGS